MSPDLVLAAAGIWVSVLLIVPKRRLGGLRRRLADAASGERRYAFGPPRNLTGEPNGVPRRLAGAAGSELSRALELGIPIYALALVAETWGRQARQVAEERWVHSPAGLLLRHLGGEIAEANLTQSLEAWGHPPPAPKLTLEVPRRYRLPPMEWRRAWEVRDGGPSETTASLVNGSGASFEAAEPVESTRQAILEFQTLGGLRVIADGVDQTSELLEHPILSFILVYLLVRAVVAPGKPTTRPMIADELFPGLDPQVQRERFRHRLSDLKALLPAVAAAVIVKGETLWFDAEACSVDALGLLDLASECIRAGGHLSGEVYSAAREALAAGDAEFLPEFAEIERRATGGRGEVIELAREAQRRLEAARVDLLTGLAESHAIRRESDRAAAYFEEALRRDPGRDDVRRQLEAIELESGRSDRRPGQTT
jgi:DNA-binding SARP family transcriptional activator